MNEIEQTDVAIIGAGPVGLFATFACGMVGLKCHVIDALDHIGGQCTALYPEKPIYDIPAYPKILGGDLITQLEAQAKPFAPVYHLSQQAVRLSGEVNQWRVTTSNHKTIACKAIIIAAGAGAFGPHKPPLENLEDFEGTSVFYAVRQRDQFRGKKIIIAGGGDSAVDWAISLSDIASVTLVHRRDQFRAHTSSLLKLHALIDAGKITLKTPYQLKALEGENGHINHVVLSDLDGHDERVAADILLAFFGLSHDLGPLKEWGLGVTAKYIPIDPATAATSQAGIFAVGDIATYPHKLKLIATGFAEAAQAAHAIRAQIYPDQDFHFEYSTTKGLPA
jgi:thioredoxin reductase (NADPH)